MTKILESPKKKKKTCWERLGLKTPGPNDSFDFTDALPELGDIFYADRDIKELSYTLWKTEKNDASTDRSQVISHILNHVIKDVADITSIAIAVIDKDGIPSTFCVEDRNNRTRQILRDVIDSMEGM